MSNLVKASLKDFENFFKSIDSAPFGETGSLTGL